MQLSIDKLNQNKYLENVFQVANGIDMFLLGVTFKKAVAFFKNTEKNPQNTIRIALIGLQNSGKSTFAAGLIGEFGNATKSHSDDASALYLYPGNICVRHYDALAVQHFKCHSQTESLIYDQKRIHGGVDIVEHAQQDKNPEFDIRVEITKNDPKQSRTVKIYYPKTSFTKELQPS